MASLCVGAVTVGAVGTYRYFQSPQPARGRASAIIATALMREEEDEAQLAIAMDGLDEVRI